MMSASVGSPVLSPSSTPRRSTPVRAITSPLSTRTAPPIPSSVDLFEPLVKAVLRHRLLYNIFAYSLAFSWIQTVICTIWNAGYGSGRIVTGILAALVWPTTLLFTLLHWAIVPLPVIILRKRYLTVTRTTASSPSILLRNASSSKSIFPVLVTYTLSAILVTLLNATGTRLGIFFKYDDAYRLNGRFVFLLTTQAVSFYGFHLRNILLDRFAFPWSKVTSVCRWPFHSRDLFDALLVVFLFTCICNLFSMVVFALARGMLSILLTVPLVTPILAPLTGHFLRGPWTIVLPFMHIPLLFKSFSLSMTTLAGLEFADMLFDAFVTQHMSVARNTSNSPLTAISGTTSSDMFIKYLAYSELCHLAADQSNRGIADRTTLFGDTKYNPTLWSRFVRETLILLGHDYQIVLRRGREPTLTSSPPPPSTVPSNLQTPGTPTHLIKKSIYKTTPNSSVRTVGDSIAAEAGAGAIHIRHFFASWQSAIFQKGFISKAWVAAVNGLRRRGNEILGRIFTRYVPLWVREVLGDSVKWWSRERIHKTVEAALPRKEIDKLAIRALSHLVCASLAEDQYGVVQRDIPQILEALSSFLSAVEQYQSEIGARHAPTAPTEPPSDEVLEEECMRLELEKAQEILADIREVLKDAIARIVRTFGNKLLAFRFPIRMTDVLQTFLDNS